MKCVVITIDHVSSCPPAAHENPSMFTALFRFPVIVSGRRIRVRSRDGQLDHCQQIVTHSRSTQESQYKASILPITPPSPRVPSNRSKRMHEASAPAYAEDADDRSRVLDVKRRNIEYILNNLRGELIPGSSTTSHMLIDLQHDSIDSSYT